MSIEVKYECLMSKSNRFVETKVSLCVCGRNQRQSKAAGKQKSKSTSTADREVYVVDKVYPTAYRPLIVFEGKFL